MDDFYQKKNERDRLVNEYKDKYKEESKKRLQTIVERKIQTAFIGALSAFEDYFGFLWSDKNSLTVEQEKLLGMLEKQGFDRDYFYEVWQNARTAALNNGNAQIRAIRQEFVNYTINWDRYRATFPVGQNNQPEEKNND